MYFYQKGSSNKHIELKATSSIAPCQDYQTFNGKQPRPTSVNFIKLSYFRKMGVFPIFTEIR